MLKTIDTVREREVQFKEQSNSKKNAQATSYVNEQICWTVWRESYFLKK